MRIVELGDFSMVIMKSSEDPSWLSVGNYYRNALKLDRPIIVDKEQLTIHYLRASEAICSAGRLILYFKDKIPSKFKLHDRVIVTIETEF